jgi:hypothetical protein
VLALAVFDGSASRAVQHKMGDARLMSTIDDKAVAVMNHPMGISAVLIDKNDHASSDVGAGKPSVLSVYAQLVAFNQNG